MHFESVSAVSEYTSQSRNMFVTTQKGAVTLNIAVPERAVSKNMFVTTKKGAVTLNFVVPERAAES